MKRDHRNFTTEIDIKYGSLGEMIRWCQHNCTGDWGYEVVQLGGESPGRYQFDFETEPDYINFILWKK